MKVSFKLSFIVGVLLCVLLLVHDARATDPPAFSFEDCLANGGVIAPTDDLAPFNEPFESEVGVCGTTVDGDDPTDPILPVAEEFPAGWPTVTVVTSGTYGPIQDEEGNYLPQFFPVGCTNLTYTAIVPGDPPVLYVSCPVLWSSVPIDAI